MTSANAKLLVIDNEPNVAAHLSAGLTPDFDVSIVSDPSDAINRASSELPNIIILDVELSGRTGYELCDDLRQHKNTSHIPIVFYSNNNSLRERMLGYEMGAVDYIHKSTDMNETKAKLNAILAQAAESKALKEEIAKVEKTAMEALTTSSELGKAVRFVEQSYTASEFDSLAAKLMDFCRSLDMSVVVMFVTRRGRRFYSSNSSGPAAIETDLIERLCSNGRFIDFGCRTLVNYTQVSLLVKNMPIENRELYGRLKDVIPFVLGATDAKVRMLDAEAIITAQYGSLSSSIEAAQLTLTTVKENFQRNLELVTSVMSELTTTLQYDIAKMTMSEQDEEHVLELIDSTSRKLHIILQENSQTDTILTELVKLLERLTLDQNSIIVNTLSCGEESAEDYDSDDVELF